MELEVEIVPAQLNFNTQELQPPTLKTLSFAQMINNHAGLFSAAKSGQLETVRYLIEKQKEDINATDIALLIIVRTKKQNQQHDGKT